MASSQAFPAPGGRFLGWVETYGFGQHSVCEYRVVEFSPSGDFVKLQICNDTNQQDAFWTKLTSVGIHEILAKS